MNIFLDRLKNTTIYLISIFLHMQKDIFGKSFQKLQENTYVRASFLMKLQTVAAGDSLPRSLKRLQCKCFFCESCGFFQNSIFMGTVNLKTEIAFSSSFSSREDSPKIFALLAYLMVIFTCPFYCIKIRLLFIIIFI